MWLERVRDYTNLVPHRTLLHFTYRRWFHLHWEAAFVPFCFITLLIFGSIICTIFHRSWIHSRSSSTGLDAYSQIYPFFLHKNWPKKAGESHDKYRKFKKILSALTNKSILLYLLYCAPSFPIHFFTIRLSLSFYNQKEDSSFTICLHPFSFIIPSKYVLPSHLRPHTLSFSPSQFFHFFLIFPPIFIFIELLPVRCIHRWFLLVVFCVAFGFSAEQWSYNRNITLTVSSM